MRLLRRTVSAAVAAQLGAGRVPSKGMEMNGAGRSQKAPWQLARAFVGLLMGLFKFRSLGEGASRVPSLVKVPL